MPMRPTKRDTRIAAAIRPAVIGKKPMPVRSALQPSTFCKYWVRKKNIENNAVPMQSIIA